MVIDPGPALPAHLAAILAALAAAAAGGDPGQPCASGPFGPVPRSGGARPARRFWPLARPTAGRSAVMQRLAEAGLTGGGEGVDAGFAPDRCLTDGDDAARSAALPSRCCTPPAIWAAICALPLGDIAFTGDHVMGWASSLISPPDGDMAAYMASLARLAARQWSHVSARPRRGDRPTPPRGWPSWPRHRRDREGAILAALKSGRADPGRAGPPDLHRHARRPCWAPPSATFLRISLICMKETCVACDAPPGPATRFHLI